MGSLHGVRSYEDKIWAKKENLRRAIARLGSLEQIDIFSKTDCFGNAETMQLTVASEGHSDRTVVIDSFNGPKAQVDS